MYLETEDVKDLIEGGLKYRKCPCCDGDGRVWFDGRIGEGGLPYPPPGIPDSALDYESCNKCEGLSYILYR